MDYRKTNAPTTTVTRDMMELCEDTGNVYESVAIIGKRANQISVEIKNDLSKKLAEFASYNDNLEEVFENREQIEISRYYEKLPKPTLIATQEYVEGKIYYRNPAKEKKNCSNDTAYSICLFVVGNRPAGCGHLHARRTVHRSGRSDGACFQASGSGFGRRRISVYLGLVRNIVAQCTGCLLYDIPFP